MFRAFSLIFVALASANNINQVTQDDPSLSTLSSLLQSAGLDKVLAGEGPFTLFAPTNDAFANLESYKIKYLQSKPDVLKKVLTYHVLGKSMAYADIIKQQNVTTLQGSRLYPIANGSGFRLDDATCGEATFVKQDVQASNGQVQVMDTVFIPPGAFCPDVIFAAEQRTKARISYYGYDCRMKGTKHIGPEGREIKPVGLSSDTASQLLFWSDDIDSPHMSNTSVIVSMHYNGTNHTKVITNAVDPQGLEADPVNQKLYFTEHSGYRVSRMNYNGTGIEVLIEKKGDDMFQPSDVTVDLENDRIFFTVEGPTTVDGSLWSMALNGSNATQLLGGLVHEYGLCIDRYNQHIFYVQGGGGGSINCYAYGSKKCLKEVLIDGLEWPYMCAVDNVWAPYGGPTTVLFSEANRPGTIYYLTSNGTNMQKIHVVTSDLDAPMGVDFGCIQENA